MQISSILLFLQVIIPLHIISNLVQEARGDDLQCDVCRAVVREANWKISQADQTKLIQVGSFRVDPNGNQNIKEKKYARSESHIEDVFETICDNLQDYAELTNEDGTKEIVRIIGMDGTRLNTKDYNLNKAFGKKLRYKCHDFLEDHVDAVISVLQHDNMNDYEQTICGEETDVCSGEQLSRPVTELPEAEPEEPVMNETEDEEEKEGDGESVNESPDESLDADDDTTQKEEL